MQLSHYTIYFALCTVLASLTACKDTIEMEEWKGKSKFVVYAFPSNSDTIPIRISTARPINGQQTYPQKVSVSCTTNDVADRIEYVETSLQAGMPVMSFYAIGKHKAGDRIEIKVSADNFSDAAGTTIIPHITDISSVELDTVFYKGDFFSQLRIQFPKKQGNNYYAARVLGKGIFEDGTIILEYKEVETSMEPMLNNYAATSIELGTQNNYYHNMYIFDDLLSTSANLSLHLSIRQQSWTKAYKVQLFTLSNEFYSMLKSLNDQGNNEIGTYGLAFISASYTNMKGGYGCIAGYNSISTDWIK